MHSRHFPFWRRLLKKRYELRVRPNYISSAPVSAESGKYNARVSIFHVVIQDFIKDFQCENIFSAYIRKHCIKSRIYFDFSDMSATNITKPCKSELCLCVDLFDSLFRKSYSSVVAMTMMSRLPFADVTGETPLQSLYRSNRH